MSARYALYWAPEADHPLWSAGCAWLGRDPSDAPPWAAPPPGRSEPWRYGVHATLKAPMRLKPGRSPQALCAALAQRFRKVQAFELPPLQVGVLGGFVALRLPHTPAPLQALADTCVCEFDDWRCAMPAAELARRSAGLDIDQRAALDRWGYPFVLSQWIFHVTLSNAIDDAAARRALQDQAQAHFATALAAPVAVRSVCVFEEPEAGQPFRLLTRIPLCD